jgi:S-methylmethionine-dependent homocysteine/selenocysteine methylase
LVASLREGIESTVLVSGCVGPRGDGYVAGEKMTADEAERYHRRQVAVFAEKQVDLASALTMTYAEEAIGIGRAVSGAGLAPVVSFTVETDGRLPSGQPLGEAIEQVDAETNEAPAYYMINCAHPTHLADVLEDGGAWRERIRGLRANASTKSHAELDEAEELDEGDPVGLATDYLALKPSLPNLNVVGGCCGTDHRHVEQLCRAWIGTSALS